MGFLGSNLRERFEENKPRGLTGDIRMISGCDDHQTSADIANVDAFEVRIVVPPNMLLSQV
jgi:hypothetical protein